MVGGFAITFAASSFGIIVSAADLLRVRAKKSVQLKILRKPQSSPATLNPEWTFPSAR